MLLATARTEAEYEVVPKRSRVVQINWHFFVPQSILLKEAVNARILISFGEVRDVCFLEIQDGSERGAETRAVFSRPALNESLHHSTQVVSAANTKNEPAAKAA